MVLSQEAQKRYESLSEQDKVTFQRQYENPNEKQQAGIDAFKQQVSTEQPKQAPIQVPVETQTPIQNPIQPVQEVPKIETTEKIQNIEAPKVEVPKVETQKTEVTPINKDTSWSDIKEKNLTNLEQLIEARYGTVASQQNGKLTATVGDKTFEWSIDAQGNPIKTEVSLTNAQKMQNKLLVKYSSASPDQLYNALLSNSIPDEVKRDISMNPNYQIAQEKLQKKKSTQQTNNIIQGMYNGINGTEVQASDYVGEMGTQRANDMIATGSTEQEVLSYRDFLAQDTELTGEIKQLNSKTTQLNELNRLADDNIKSIKAEYPGLDNGSAMLLNARQLGPVYDQIEAITDEIGVLQANVKYREGIINEDWEQITSQRALEEQRSYDEEQSIAQLEREYAFTYGDINSDNPTLQNIAIQNAVAGMYQNYPLPGMESQATKVQKVQNLIAQGMSGSEAIAQVESEIRNSQRYKDYIASQAPQASTTFDFKELGDKTYKINETTGEYEVISGGESGTTPTNAVSLISKWEGFRDKAYQDVGGVWTIGHGFTRNEDGTEIQPGQTMSREESESRLEQEISNRQNYMNYIEVPLSESQKAALSSFEFNLGSGIWDKNAMPILDAINAGDNQRAAVLLKQYNQAGGEYVQGLANRRNEEAQLLQNTSMDNSEEFAYAETLTASDRKKFLDERGLEDAYINYKAKQGTAGADFSDITDITDINFPEKVTQYKSDSYGYGNRMDTSSDIISKMAKKYEDSWSLTEALGAVVPNFLKTNDRQQFEQAQRNFINAILRKESGAVISDQEFDNAAKQYFPRPGDTADVMRQKEVNRFQVIENMYRNAGKDDKGRNIVDIYKNLKPERVVGAEELISKVEFTAPNGKVYEIK